MARGVGIPTFVAGAMIGQLTASSATRDASFLSKFEATALPYVMGISAILSIAIVWMFSRLLQRFAPDRVLPAAFACNAGLFVAEAALDRVLPDVSAIAVYLHTMALGGVLVSGFWSLMAERFDPHTAKRVFGRITAGASIGGVLGGLGAWQAGTVASMSTLLFLLAAVNLACAAALVFSRRQLGPLAPVAPSVASASSKARGAPYLRLVAALVVLAAIADICVDYAMKANAASTYTRGRELIEFFALFYTVVGVGAFLLQVFVTRPLLRVLGLTRTLACHPVAVAAGSVLAMLVPGLWVITFVRGGDGALKSSLFKPGYELLYTPLSPQQKRASKTQIDVGFSRFGGFAGSGLVLLAIAVSPENAVSLLLGVAVVVAAASGVVVVIVHRGYVKALADSLTSGTIRLEPGDVIDATTRMTLAQTSAGIQMSELREQMDAIREQRASQPRPGAADPLVAKAIALRSGDADQIRQAIVGELDPQLVGLVLPLLARDELVEDITRAVRTIADRVTGQLVDVLVDAEQSTLVRRRIPRILVASATQRSVSGLQLALAADNRDIRHRTALALERILEHDPGLAIDRNLILQAVRIEVRQLGGDHDARRLQLIFVLLGLILDRGPLKLAHRALSSTDTRLRGTGLEYLENVVPPEIHELLGPHLGAGAKPSTERRTRERIADELQSLPGLDTAPDELERSP